MVSPFCDCVIGFRYTICFRQVDFYSKCLIYSVYKESEGLKYNAQNSHYTQVGLKYLTFGKPLSMQSKHKTMRNGAMAQC